MIRSEVSRLVDAGINKLYLEIRILEINTRIDYGFDKKKMALLALAPM